MTIENENVRQQHSVVNGQANYGYNFRALQESDLKVVVTSNAGVDTTQTLNTHYTVSGVGGQSGGTIHFDSSHIPNTSASSTVTIVLDPELKQNVDLSYGASIDSEALEGALDKSVNMAKRAIDLSDRGLHLTDGSPATGGSYDANSNRLTNLTAGTAATDAINKTQHDVVVATTTHVQTGNAALGTRMLNAETNITNLLPMLDERAASFYMHSDGVEHNFNSGTATLVPFGNTRIGGSAASGGQYTTPFHGLWFVSVTLTPANSSLTVDDRWIVSIGYPPESLSANRSWFEVSGDPDVDTITLSTMISLGSGAQVGAYVRRFSGSGNFTLNTAAADNQIAGFCVKKY